MLIKQTDGRVLFDLFPKESSTSSEKLLLSTDNHKFKQAIAGGAFYGVYYAGINTIPEYCASTGQPINSFVQAFEQIHKPLLLTTKGMIEDIETGLWKKMQKNWSISEQKKRSKSSNKAAY